MEMFVLSFAPDIHCSGASVEHSFWCHSAVFLTPMSGILVQQEIDFGGIRSAFLCSLTKLSECFRDKHTEKLFYHKMARNQIRRLSL